MSRNRFLLPRATVCQIRLIKLKDIRQSGGGERRAGYAERTNRGTGGVMRTVPIGGLEGLGGLYHQGAWGGYEDRTTRGPGGVMRTVPPGGLGGL